MENNNIHIHPIIELHEPSPKCWCDPKLDIETKEGNKVYIHNRIQ